MSSPAASASASAWPGPWEGTRRSCSWTSPSAPSTPSPGSASSSSSSTCKHELKKTIVFVTHDIEEATKLGDRIAVLSKGGVLEQYDTPSEVLGRPATAFVADFVGADRGVRRLAVMPIEPDDLFHPPRVAPELSMLDARAAVGRSGQSMGGGGGR